MEETQKTKKQSPVVVIIIVILVLGFIGSTVSRMMLRARIKTATGGILNVKNNGEYQVKTKEGEVLVSDDKSLAWPSDLPISLPKYDNGKIKAVSHLNEQTAWTIIMSDTNEEYFKKYKEMLKTDGWAEESEMAAVVSMISMKKEGYNLNVVWDSSSNGALITVSKSL